MSQNNIKRLFEVNQRDIILNNIKKWLLIDRIGYEKLSFGAGVHQIVNNQHAPQGTAVNGSTTVHNHLSNLVWEARELLANAVAQDSRTENIATAALTIIIEYPNVKNEVHLKAFTSVVYDIAVPNNALIAATTHLRKAVIPEGAAVHYAYQAGVIAPALNNIIANFASNHDDTECTEKQLIARLFTPGMEGGPGLFRHMVANLLAQANEVVNGTPITYSSIKVVVLHIHTTKDPCAKCARLLAGVSRQMNMQPHTAAGLDANKQTVAMTALLNAEFPIIADDHDNPSNLIDNLANGNARFLVEISSNSHYGVNECNHAECSGNDGNLQQQKIIMCNNGRLNFAGVANLVIPNGVGVDNWHFPIAGVGQGNSIGQFI